MRGGQAGDAMLPAVRPVNACLRHPHSPVSLSYSTRPAHSTPLPRPHTLHGRPTYWLTSPRLRWFL